jgi:ribose transport system ATP-binding protein
MLNLIRSVARAGSSVIFITHRLQEAVDTADSITVLRDGRIADTFPTSGIDARRIIAAMLGRELESFYPDPAVPADEAIMRVTELSGETLNAVSFELIKGEIVGFAGLVGAGHEEVPYLLAGARDAASGNAQMAGDDVLTLSLRARLERGIVLVPGNRHRDGLWMAGTASENITLPQLREFRRPWGLDHAGEHCASRSLMERFGVRPPSPGRMVNEFSGGNQQKIVLAKWLYRHPKVLLLDEPTQGIDAGAKRELLDLMMEIAAGGTSILIASGDYEQLANVCNRVYVIRSGRLVTQLRGEDVTEDRITEQAQAGAPIVTSNATTPSLTRRDPHEKGPFET